MGVYRGKTAIQNDFIKIFNSLCLSRNRWNVWQDFVLIVAYSISNAVDKEHFDEREKAYLDIIRTYKSNEVDKISELYAILIQVYETSIDQDFLGELYMGLELGNKNNGQFFTPYSICKMMSKITGKDVKQRIRDNGWIGVNDPTCGAGATLVAFANECLENDINYQTTILFTAQDIDYITGCMCYIQLSLLGCAGYVTIANTLSNPSLSICKGLIPVIQSGQTIFYTPFYFRKEWVYRRLFNQMDYLININQKNDTKCIENKKEEAQTNVLIENKNGQLSFF